MKRLFFLLFKRLGFELKSLRHAPHVAPGSSDADMSDGLERFRRLKVPVKTVIDVGAAMGNWSVMTQRIFPDCEFLLFEPLEERQAELAAVCNSNNKFHYIPAAAGKEQGVLPFFVASDLDGSAVSNDIQSHRRVNVTSISQEIYDRGLSGPFIVKLDTHGYEVPILDGAKAVLDDVALFVIECYGFRIAQGSLLFWEMCQYMDELGFRLFDIVDVMHRQKDGAFWQCDAFFIPKSHPIFVDNEYK